MKLFTSSETRTIITLLNENTGLKLIDLACISFALSLKSGIRCSNLDDCQDNKGTEFNEYTLSNTGNGEYYRALLSCIYEKNLTDDEFFSSKSYFKFHVDHGASILRDIRENKANQDKNLFIIKLSSYVSL